MHTQVMAPRAGLSWLAAASAQSGGRLLLAPCTQPMTVVQSGRRSGWRPQCDTRVMTDDEIDAFLLQPRDAVLSVALPRSGRAVGTPVWFMWIDGVARFQSPTTTAKTQALRATGRASLCVHEQPLPMSRYVTLEGPVREVAFDLERDIVASAHHYLGEDAPAFLGKIDQALAAGREWASFELTPTLVSARDQSLL